MTITSQTFDTNLPTWKEWQNAPWGRLRYNLAQANLRRHLDLERHPLRVLDVGGGNGVEALALAALGHTVTLTDFSAQMLQEAERSALEMGLADRLTLHRGELASLEKRLSQASFDLVLCHNVIQYVDDAAQLIQAMGQVLKPGGVLSLICVNRYSEPYKAALQRVDLVAAQDSLEAPQAMAALFGVPVQRYAAQELIIRLEASGCEMLGQYGIRCLCDYIPNNDLKHDPQFYAQLEALEYAMSDKYPYYLVARFFQLIGRKPMGE